MKITSESYQVALDVQGACNLSGIVRAWIVEIDKLNAYARENNKGTEFVNAHPINKLFANKVADLCRAVTFTEYLAAYDECKQRAKGGKNG